MNAFYEALAEATQKLSGAGIDSARADARILLAHAVGIAPADMLSAVPSSDGWRSKFDAAIARRTKREPIAFITGNKEFWSLDFAVGPGVLVPRPETETLVEEALKEFPDRASPLVAADLGAGTGCILISFLTEFQAARGVAVEGSPDAAVYLRKNAALAGDRIVIVESDWSDAPAEPFDLIFCNPPYLAAKELGTVAPELRWEPLKALVSGGSGTEAYQVLAPLIGNRLKPNGLAFLEIGLGQSDAVSEIMVQHGLEMLRIAPDLSGIPRCAVVRRPLKKQLE